MAYYVYELACELRHELYVGVTTAVDSELARLRREPPSPLAEWPNVCRTKLRIVEIFEEALAAREFAARYGSSALPEGWRFVSPVAPDTRSSTPA